MTRNGRLLCLLVVIALVPMLTPPAATELKEIAKKDIVRRTALSYAAKSGQREVVANLLRSPQEPPNAPSIR